MEEKIEKLKNFIEKYGEDFLSDGTKAEIVKSIEEGDDKLILEILQVMDKDWIARTKEVGKFFIFTDHYEQRDKNGYLIRKPFILANYIDSSNSGERKIPTLRKVKPRIRAYRDFFEGFGEK